MSPENLLPFGIGRETLFIFMTAIAVFVAVLALWLPLLDRGAAHERIRSLAKRREVLKAGIAASQHQRHAERSRIRGLSLMNRVVTKLKLKKSEKARSIGDKLAQAGWRGPEFITAYLFSKVVMPFITAAGGAFLLFVVEIMEASSAERILYLLGSFVLGFYVPDIYISNTRSKRQDILRKGLPDALDLMVICAEAGLSMDASFQRVAREMGRACPEIAEEFELTAIELGFLPERRQALMGLSARTGLPAVRGVVNTLVQTEKYGTPLANALRVLSSEFRTERILKAEEKAARLPAIMTVPLIFFVLPPLFVVVLGPGILMLIDGLGEF